MTLLFGAVLAVLLTGAAFLPLGSGPDEAAHYVYASAVVRGQAGILEPTVPARIANMHDFATCIAFQPNITAACQGPLRIESVENVVSQTNAGYYNPVFYAWTGLGSLILPTESGLYLARALAALVTALFLAWTLSLTWRRAASPWPLIGIGLLLTPMTMYLGMVLNANGWETVTLAAVAMSAYLLLSTPAGASGWHEEHSLLLSAGALLIVTRGLSPAFLLLAGIVLFVAFRWVEVRSVFRRRSSWVILAVFVVLAVVSVVWVRIHGTFYVGVVPPSTLWDGIQSISIFYSRFQEQVTQMYASWGWLDLPSPHVLSTTWLLLLGCFLLVSFAITSPRQRIAILIAFIIAAGLPGVLAGLQWSGSGWQGRYSLPLVATLLAVCAWTGDSALRRTTREGESISQVATTLRYLVAGFFLLGMTVMAVRATHRYSVGDAAPWLAPASWTPPVPLWILAAGLFGGLLAMSASLTLRAPLWGRPEDAGSGAGRGDATGITVDAATGSQP